MKAHPAIQMNDPLLDYFASQWKAVRGLTIDLLLSLSDDELKATPGKSLGPWWKQFRHVGRVQENYLNSVETGIAKFGFEGTTYSAGQSRQELHNYLQRLDQNLAKKMNVGFPRTTIDWFGEPKSIAQHLLCLAEHEVLHHGQWMVYRKLLGGRFPKSWSVWGVIANEF